MSERGDRRSSARDMDSSSAPPSPEHEQQQTNGVREIPAAKVRSGLSDLEHQTTQALHRLENIKFTTETPPSVAESASTAAASLPADHKASGDIFAQLECLIAHTDNSDDEGAFTLPPLDEVSQFALLTHSIVAYMSHLEYRKLARITTQICADTTRWLSHLFRFVDAASSFHSDTGEAILRAVRLAIVTRCPGYLEGGIAALASPCMYVSENSGTLGLVYACRQLGLPVSCIRTVPTNTTFGALGTVDVAALQKILAVDVAAGRTPLFMIADAGTSMCGYVDNIGRLHDVCRANAVWLHCRGHSLAAIAVARGTSAAGDAEPIADSIALSLSGWLGLPILPVVLLHRPINNAALTVFESDPVLSRRLTVVTLWTTLQALGRDVISERLLTSFEVCRNFYDIVAQFEDILVLSKPPGGDTKATIAELEHRPLVYSLLFDTATAVVVFQFDGHAVQAAADAEHAAAIKNGGDGSTADDTEDGDAQHSDSSEFNQSLIHKSIEKVVNTSYFEKLNSWLGQNLQRDCPEIDLELVDHPQHGTCVRFCPFELGLGQTVPRADHLEKLADCLDAQLDILRATVRNRGVLHRLVQRSEVLRLVTLADWAGLGGVRFVPEGWERLLTDQAKTELNKLNADLVDKLRSTDNAFSMGEGADGMICVRFGMVTMDTDVEELLDLVVSVGKRVQENSKVLDTMSEIVKKGIETATADLQRESDEKLWSEGILRHVPVFGQVVNWWSPPVKETGIKGRSLNLTQGVVESTENIYKYHMQLSAQNNNPKPGSKSPPAPLVQTSVSANHSRNVSQGSVASATEVTLNQPDVTNTTTTPPSGIPPPTPI